MKTISKSAPAGCVVLAIVALLLTQCGSPPKEAAQPTYSGTTAASVTHSVKNYNDWLKVYNAKSDSASRISIYVSPEDPNLLTVYSLTVSHADAKAMFASEELKNSMKEAGVTSEPMISYFDMKYRAPGGMSAKKYRILIQHEVADYDVWKKVFDADEPRRTEAGLELRAISTDAYNPKLVGMMFATDNAEQASAMMSSEDLKAKMKEAGVTSEPVVKVMMLPPAN